MVDCEKYPVEIFKELYHSRWAQDEAYKLLKCRIGIEQFSGKTALKMQQYFYAKIFLLTLTAAFAHPIAEKVKAEFKADENRKFNQQINRTNAIASICNVFMGLFLQNIPKALQAFDDVVYKTREIIRPNRKNPRKHRLKKPYSMNYKPLFKRH